MGKLHIFGKHHNVKFVELGSQGCSDTFGMTADIPIPLTNISLHPTQIMVLNGHESKTRAAMWQWMGRSCYSNSGFCRAQDSNYPTLIMVLNGHGSKTRAAMWQWKGRSCCSNSTFWRAQESLLWYQKMQASQR